MLENLKKYTQIIPSAFGLDISDSSVKFVQLSKEREGLGISIFGEKFIPEGAVSRGLIKEPQEISKILTTVFQKFKYSGLSEYAILSLPDEQTFLQVISLPFLSGEELESAIFVEAERNIPIDLDDAYLDYFILEKNDDNLKILLAAANKTVVDGYIKVVVDAGLKPVVIEPEVIAIARSIVSEKEKNDAMIIIELGANRTRLIGYSNYGANRTSSIDFSAEYINNLVAKELKMDLQEVKKINWDVNLLQDPNYGALIKKVTEKPLSDLAKAVKNNIASWDSDEYKLDSVKRIILSGGGASIPSITEKISSLVGIPTGIGNPIQNIRGGKDIPMSQKTSLLFTTALGLAFRGSSLDEKSIYKDFV